MQPLIINKKTNHLVHILLVPVPIILLFFLNYYLGLLINNTIVVPFILPASKAFDPYNAYTSNLFISLGVASLSFLLIILTCFLTKKPLGTFGFNLNNFKYSLKFLGIFLFSFMGLYITFGSLAARYNLFDYTLPYPLNLSNITGAFLFQLLFSGLEEVFFRSFIITLLLMFWAPLFESQRKLEFSAVLASSFIFTMRHIGINFFPFEITYLVPLQLLVVTVMGISFGFIFVKSKSLLGAYLTHGLSNACIFVFLLVLNAI